MDKSLSEIQGVHFFFSAVTGTTTNKRRAKSSNADKSHSSQPTKDSEKSPQVENEKEDNENLYLDSNMGLPEVRFYQGISYFICFSQTDGCHPDRFVQCLQHDMDMDVSPIQVRLRSTESTHTDYNGNSNIDRLIEELCNVLKDHNNVSIQNLVKYSFNYCYTLKLTESVSDWSDKKKNFVFGDQMQCERI